MRRSTCSAICFEKPCHELTYCFNINDYMVDKITSNWYDVIEQ
jgi:hypothetical protein